MNKECRLSLGGGEKLSEELDKQCIEFLSVVISDMASAFPPSAKWARTAAEAPSVRKQGKEVSIPWDEICPTFISEWLDTFSKANNTTRDILLASVLPTVACLMGPSTVKVDCRIRAETVNLYMICLCDPGAGKSPAFQHGCAQPIRLHVEAKEDNPLFVDEFTEAGLISGSLNQHLAIKPSLARRKHPSFLNSCWVLPGKRAA